MHTCMRSQMDLSMRSQKGLLMRSQIATFMHVLLIEPTYRTRYPPLGLLKIASHHRKKNDSIELIRGCKPPEKRPDRIYVTSLFTWTWKSVKESISYYKKLFPDVKVWLGGIYASLLPDHARKLGADHIHVGLKSNVESLMPAYDLVPEWDGSIIFSSRGCNRRCPWCAVWQIEGKINSCKKSIKNLIYPKHTRVILWDNNILQSPHWRQIFEELIGFGRKVDFNQGLDARLITDEVAERLSKMKLQCARISYDYKGVREQIRKAIQKISYYGIRRRSILVYVLYNFRDDPDDFYNRIKDVLNWGAVVYPMRYEPLDMWERWKFVSPNWDTERLELVEDFRRVYGYGGTFPPYRWLVDRFNKLNSFDDTFKLPVKGMHQKRVNKPYHAKWQRESDWRIVKDKVLSKQW